MSTELNQLVTDDSNCVNVTSFHGGQERKRCLQLTQGYRSQSEASDAARLTVGYVQLDRQQVVQLMKEMAEWLGGE